MLLALGDLGAEEEEVDEEEAEAAMMANWGHKPQHQPPQQQTEQANDAVATAVPMEVAAARASEEAVAAAPVVMDEVVEALEHPQQQPQPQAAAVTVAGSGEGKDVYAVLGLSKEEAEATVRACLLRVDLVFTNQPIETVAPPHHHITIITPAGLPAPHALRPRLARGGRHAVVPPPTAAIARRLGGRGRHRGRGGCQPHGPGAGLGGGGRHAARRRQRQWQ